MPQPTSPEEPTSFGRLTAEIETVGVQPVQDRDRTMNSWRLFIVFAMASASATTPLIGLLLYKMGLTNMIIAIIVAFLIGLVPAGIFSEMGRELPLTALIVARKTFGRAGALVFAVFFTFVNVGWFGLNTEVGGQILSAIFHTRGEFWFWAIGAIQIILVLFGMKWLEYFYRYTSVILIVCYGALTIYLFTHFHLHVPQAVGYTPWGGAITTILIFSILSWTYKISTVSRFAVPADKTLHRTRYFLAPSIGIMISVLLMGVVGIFSQQATGNWNIALFGATIPIWGVIAAVGVALAVVHTNALNLYPSTVDLLAAVNTIAKPTKWEQPVATLFLGILSTLLAIYGILAHVQGFLDILGDFLVPFTFIMITDWVWIQRKRTPVEEFFATPKTFGGWISLPALAGWVVGFALSFWGQDILPGFFYNVLPLPVVASVVASGVYWVLMAKRAVPAEPVLDEELNA